jgi:hypothetical protein
MMLFELAAEVEGAGGHELVMKTTERSSFGSTQKMVEAAPQ